MLTLLITLAVPFSFSGQWMVSRDVDPVTGAGSVWAIIGNQEEHLAVGCLRGQPLQVAFRSWRSLGESDGGSLGGSRPVTYQVGSLTAVTANWDYERSAVIQHNPGLAVQLVEQLSRSSTLSVRVMNNARQNVDFRFNYQDPSGALAEATEFCRAGPSGPSRR